MCSKGSGRNIIPFFYAQEPDLRAVTPTHNVWLSPSDAVGPGLNLFGRANHYSTGRSPVLSRKKNKIIFGGMNFSFYLCGEQKNKKIMSNLETQNHWNKVAKEVLKGRTIVEVRYLNDQEMEDMGWYKRPICFFLDNGTNCILSMDDEGNDGGVLFYGQNGVLPTL